MSGLTMNLSTDLQVGRLLIMCLFFNVLMSSLWSVVFVSRNGAVVRRTYP
jgi:hypothetical protein